MNKKIQTKRFLSLLITLVLILSTLPIQANAVDLPWAEDAVRILNDVYGNGTFSASDDMVTVGTTKALLTNTFKLPDDNGIISTYLNGDPDSNLTRLQLAQIIFSLYGFVALVNETDTNTSPFTDCTDSKVTTLYKLGIVSGKSTELFVPDGYVTNAELSVMFYRALGKAGGIGKKALENSALTPGAYGYDELMYLFTRGCVPRDIDPSQELAGAEIEVTTYIAVENKEEPVKYTGKKDIWNAWCTRLGSLPPERSLNWTGWASWDQVTATTILDAAIQIVATDRAALGENMKGIFSDVYPSTWYYDGIMYLFNNGIVSGYGNGQFGPSNEVNRAALAVLLCRINNINTTDPDGTVTSISDVPSNHWAYNSVTHAIAQGYMTYKDSSFFYPDAMVTRQEAALEIFECYNKYSANDVNLSVLERFNDCDDIGNGYADVIRNDYRTALAYFVSAGVLNGTEDGMLLPQAEVTRAEFGVFLARVMKGLDQSKMHDYKNWISEVLQ